MKSLLEKIGEFFKGLFNAAARTFKKLPEEVQDAMKNGSAMIAMINSNVELDSDQLAQLLEEHFPDVHEVIEKLCYYYNLLPVAHDFSFVELVDLVKNYLKNSDGSIWAGLSKAGASFISIFYAPEGTKFEAISSLIGYVYHKFFKKD